LYWKDNKICIVGWEKLRLLRTWRRWTKALVSDIFGCIQYMPLTLSISFKSKSKLWIATEESIYFMANLVFYKLK
jgi:hypothetical protein